MNHDALTDGLLVRGAEQLWTGLPGAAVRTSTGVVHACG